MISSDTFFAPAEKASVELLLEQKQSVLGADFVATMLDAIPVIAMILNGQRQIVAVNKLMLQALDVDDAGLLIGRRPGEVLECIHACGSPGGCGCSRNCSVCGALNVLLESLERGCQSSGECRLLLAGSKGMALDFDATASPLHVAGKRFTVFALRDISAEKRKKVMERTFFHDIINTAGGIYGLACLLVEQEDLSRDSEQEYKGLMVSLSDSLIEDIRHQSRLMSAELGEYVPRLETVDLDGLLRAVCELYGHHDRVPGRSVRFESAGTCLVRTDVPVLRRIVGNMLLNAMEAVDAGETVQVSCHSTPELVRIEVGNPGEMPPDIRMQVFERSFSSKGATGRGIGTYSMKLFGERYLGGKVGFSCGNGRTTFYFEFPPDGILPRVHALR